MLLILLLSCAPGSATIGDKAPVGSSDGNGGEGGEGGEGGGDSPVEPAAWLTGPAVFDPLLGGPATFTLDGDGELPALSVAVVDADGLLVASLGDGLAPDSAVSWTGLDESGQPWPSATYTVVIQDAQGERYAEEPLALVRVGLTEGTLGGDRLPLLWHDAGRGTWDDGADAPTFALDGLVDDDGAARAVPDPWDDLDSPPEDETGHNLPAGYRWDARPTLRLVVDGDLGGASVSASLEGWTLLEGAAEPGEALVFQKDSPLTSGPGVFEETLNLSWEAAGARFATQAIPLRIYALMGPATFEDAGSPYMAWVAVVDPALRAMDGVAPEEEAVLAALVDHVYHDLGLAYDTRYGASYYVSYSGWSWESATTNLSGFLSRSRGSTVNCSDCAGILTAYANMVGVLLNFSIIEPRFDLNYIKAIGYDDYTSCPFGPGSCSFSYHAVTSPDDGGVIYDATLALDGDDDPGDTPHDELLVQAVDGDEYMDRLVRSGRPAYEHYGTGKLK